MRSYTQKCPITSVGIYKTSGTSDSVSIASRPCNSQKPCQLINAVMTSTKFTAIINQPNYSCINI